MTSPQTFTEPRLFSEFVWDAALEVPKVAPWHALCLAVTSLHAVRFCDDSTLDLSFWGAEIDNAVLLFTESWSDHARPEKWFFSGCVRHQFRIKGLSWCFTLLNDEVAEFFVLQIFFASMPWENWPRNLLGHLTEMAPWHSWSSQRTFTMMGAWCHNICFIPRFSFNNPLTEAMHIPEALRTTRLYKHYYTTISQPLVQSVHN